MSQSQENLWMGGRADRRRDRQTLFYRTFPAEVGGGGVGGGWGEPTTSLQQVTGGSTPNLVFKRECLNIF